MLEEASPARRTVKRLMEAEEQARQILNAAEERAKGTIAQAREQAKQSLEAARQETESLLRSRLEEVKSKAVIEMRTQLGEAEEEAREIERQATEHFAAAVEMVVDWVTNRGE